MPNSSSRSEITFPPRNPPLPLPTLPWLMSAILRAEAHRCRKGDTAPLSFKGGQRDTSHNTLPNISLRCAAIAKLACPRCAGSNAPPKMPSRNDARNKTPRPKRRASPSRPRTAHTGKGCERSLVKKMPPPKLSFLKIPPYSPKSSSCFLPAHPASPIVCQTSLASTKPSHTRETA